jgi:hypothetical protein
MRKPGIDENNVQMSDVLCDFCGAEWTETLPMVEGHQGSTICGRCLSEACRAVLVRKQGAAEAGAKCTMCLENRPEPGWRSPTRPEAVACKRCINQSAAILAKDKEMGWERPKA